MERQRPSPAPSDADVARAARDGSRAAFTILVERYQQRLYRFLRLRTSSPEDAEELLQDTFLRCWTKLHHFDVRRAFAPWLYTLAARLAVTRGRRARPAASERDPDDLPANGGDPAADLLRREESQNLWDLALRVLGPQPRAALWLFYGERLSAREIGAILGKREEAVRAVLLRARARLAAELSLTQSCERER